LESDILPPTPLRTLGAGPTQPECNLSFLALYKWADAEAAKVTRYTHAGNKWNSVLDILDSCKKKLRKSRN